MVPILFMWMWSQNSDSYSYSSSIFDDDYTTENKNIKDLKGDIRGEWRTIAIYALFLGAFEVLFACFGLSHLSSKFSLDFGDVVLIIMYFGGLALMALIQIYFTRRSLRDIGKASAAIKAQKGLPQLVELKPNEFESLPTKKVWKSIGDNLVYIFLILIVFGVLEWLGYCMMSEEKMFSTEDYATIGFHISMVAVFLLGLWAEMYLLHYVGKDIVPAVKALWKHHTKAHTALL